MFVNLIPKLRQAIIGPIQRLGFFSRGIECASSARHLNTAATDSEGSLFDLCADEESKEHYRCAETAYNDAKRAIVDGKVSDAINQIEIARKASAGIRSVAPIAQSFHVSLNELDRQIADCQGGKNTSSSRGNVRPS